MNGITPEEEKKWQRATEELIKELGFRVRSHVETTGIAVCQIDLNLKSGMPATIAGTIEEWKLWSLALRQRMELNALKSKNNQ